MLPGLPQRRLFFKALGTGWFNDTAFNEVEIINNKQGKPEIILLGLTNDTVIALGDFNIMVSISHIKLTATAIVILEDRIEII